MIQELKSLFALDRDFYLFVILFTLGIGIICGFIVIADSKDLDPVVLERLGIEADEFSQYLEETFVNGMAREDVYQEMEKFGDYKVIPFDWGAEDRVCELIEMPMKKTLVGTEPTLTFLACFSVEDDTLVRWTLNS